MTAAKSPWYSVLYIQVLLAIAVGILIGHYFPDAAARLKETMAHPVALGEEMEGQPV